MQGFVAEGCWKDGPWSPEVHPQVNWLVPTSLAAGQLPRTGWCDPPTCVCNPHTNSDCCVEKKPSLIYQFLVSQDQGQGEHNRSHAAGLGDHQSVGLPGSTSS